MRHNIVFKRSGYYSGMPNLTILGDGRLAIGARVQNHGSHEPVGDWRAFISEDAGDTWSESDAPDIPFNWPGATPREKMERVEIIQPDGNFICAGAKGAEYWPEDRRAEAEKLGLRIREHPPGSKVISVGGDKLFVARSGDQGKTWSRREWVIPGVAQVSGNRPATIMGDGTVLIHIYTAEVNGDSRNYVWRSTDHGDSWRLHPMGTHPLSLKINETAMVEVDTGTILAHQRIENAPQYLVERWSHDGGLTWTEPLRTDIWGYPAHLLKLRDGRILCAYGYRRDPGGVRAVLSADGGYTWNTENVIVLRDDGGYSTSLREGNSGWASDLGYPISVQLEDESILTAYYITENDGITHTAVTRWDP